MGGMERVVCELLASSKDFLFCTDSEGQLYEGALAQAKICVGRQARLLVVDWVVVWKLVRFIHAHKIECLHAHNHVAHLYAVLASVLTRVPVVVTLHGQGYFDTPRTLKLRRWLSRLTRVVVVVSKDVGDVVVKSGAVPREKIKIIPNGVDTISFSPSPFRGDGWSEGVAPVCIGSIGRLASEKNYPLLIRAFAVLEKAKELKEAGSPRPTPRLLLIGDGSERGAIEALIREFGLEKQCTLAGMQTDVLPWLHQMDLFCLSSDTEGLSMTLLEACACGLPCVVTDVGGNAEIVADGISGFVVPRGDVNALSVALTRLMADAELRRQMGQAARRIVEEKFSLAAMVEGYEQVYADIVAAAAAKWWLS